MGFCRAAHGEQGMTAETWDEIRTAYHVARLGTVSAAAEVLGVHHATVIRHVDALEARLGVKLFQRHARGYTPTEAGQDLLHTARIADNAFAQLAGRVRGQGAAVEGELLVTSIPGLARWLAPSLARFQAAHPGLVVRYLTGERVFRLEYGEAHVAVRAGAEPAEPDYVVQPYCTLPHALYAASAYVAAHGLPASEAELARHRIVAHDDPDARPPFFRWLRAHVPERAYAFRAIEFTTLIEAVKGGAGIGFVPVWEARGLPDLVQVMPPRREWEAPLWLVTHVDLHRSAKVQACLRHLKEDAQTWPAA
jgi:DNA-binding transcriptional LysR family regulator